MLCLRNSPYCIHKFLRCDSHYSHTHTATNTHTHTVIVNGKVIAVYSQGWILCLDRVISSYSGLSKDLSHVPAPPCSTLLSLLSFTGRLKARSAEDRGRSAVLELCQFANAWICSASPLCFSPPSLPPSQFFPPRSVGRTAYRTPPLLDNCFPLHTLLAQGTPLLTLSYRLDTWGVITIMIQINSWVRSCCATLGAELDSDIRAWDRTTHRQDYFVCVCAWRVGWVRPPTQEGQGQPARTGHF